MWGLVLSAANRARSAFAFPAFIHSNRNADTAGRVGNTDSKARTRLLKLSEREVLIAKIKDRQRNHLSTSDLRRRLVRLTAEIAADV